MLQARTKRLALCLLMSAFAVGSVTRVSADQLFFANGRSMSVKDYRVEGDLITVTLRNGGQASFDKAIVAEIKPDELPPLEETVPVETVAPVAIKQSSRAAHAPLDARPFADLIETVALKHGVDPELVHAVVLAESGYRADARSNVGARGLMQVMPSTAKDFGIRNLYDPQNNLEAGVQYLKFLLVRFPGDLKRAIAAYNAGPGAVAKYRGIPPYRETQQYVNKVLQNFRD
jgi:soluble lytic murein transglycosylase-like protein